MLSLVCDVVSAFRGKGKKSTWQTRNVCNDASKVFNKLSKFPLTVGEEDIEMVEKFVIAMYNRSTRNSNEWPRTYYVLTIGASVLSGETNCTYP